jgi:cytochrome P450
VGEAVGALFSGEHWLDPYPLYDTIRSYGPLVRIDDRFWVASGYAEAVAILRDPRMLVPDRELAELQGIDSSEEAVLGDSMLRTNPPDHTRMRRLAAGAFTPRRVEAMRTAVTEQAITLARYLAHLAKRGDAFDVVGEFAYPLPIRVICSLLGVPATDQHWFREQAQALTTVLEPALLVTDVDEAVRARSRLGLYFSDLVRTRRAEARAGSGSSGDGGSGLRGDGGPGSSGDGGSGLRGDGGPMAGDLVTALIQAHDADGATLSTRELIANLILLLVAGFETTTNLIGNGLAVLLERPDLAAALRADPALTASFVEETLRFDSPVQLTTRWCREPVEVHGVTVEPYSQVLVLLGAANRDPARYPNPHTFDPTRTAVQPLSFGAGGHYCLGAALARMEAQVAFPLLLQLLPRLTLVAPPLRRPRLTLRGFVEIPVTA